jgi:hypothetical protein
LEVCRTPSPEEIISWAGEWNPVTKTQTVRPGQDGVWAGYDTSSERLDNGLWSLSAASLFNTMQTLIWTLNVKFNEVSTAGWAQPHGKHCGYTGVS